MYELSRIALETKLFFRRDHHLEYYIPNIPREFLNVSKTVSIIIIFEQKMMSCLDKEETLNCYYSF